MAHFSDGREKEHRKVQRLTEENARGESAWAAAVEQKREKSPILTLDHHAILGIADAERPKRGISSHTLRSFLIHRQDQGHLPQAAHQKEAPKGHMEQDLHLHHGRSQGAPSLGHCQEGHQ